MRACNAPLIKLLRTQSTHNLWCVHACATNTMWQLIFQYRSHNKHKQHYGWCTSITNFKLCVQVCVVWFLSTVQKIVKCINFSLRQKCRKMISILCFGGTEGCTIAPGFPNTPASTPMEDAILWWILPICTCLTSAYYGSSYTIAA